MKKIIITSIVIIAAVVGIFFTLKKNKAKNEAQTAIVAEKNTAVAVRAATADYMELSMEYISNGVFAPKQEVMIAAETPGRVARVLVKEGSMVGAGQTLAVIEADKQNVNVSNAQAVYNNAKVEVNRFENAYASGGVTQQQLDQVKLQLENARNSLRNAQITASDVNVRASFAGIVNTRSVEPGSYVNSGQQMFEIVNISTLKLKVNVDEKNIGTIQTGQEVNITSAVLPDQAWKGIVTFIAPKGDASLNFPVELEIRNNIGKRLKAGMFGTAKFGDGQKDSVFVVPRAAFVGNVSSNQVFTVKNGIAHLTQVVSGRNYGDYVEIISGIEKGAQVVVTGQINLINGTAVSIIQ